MCSLSSISVSQAVGMFLGELSCLAAFYILLCHDRRSPEPKMNPSSFNPLLFFAPAMCDMTATSIMYVGKWHQPSVLIHSTLKGFSKVKRWMAEKQYRLSTSLQMILSSDSSVKDNVFLSVASCFVATPFSFIELPDLFVHLCWKGRNKEGHQWHKYIW